MTIDERLENLTVTVEALKDGIDRLFHSTEQLRDSVKLTATNVDQVVAKVDRLVDFVNDHEERVLALEDRREQRIERHMRETLEALRRIERRLEGPNA